MEERNFNKRFWAFVSLVAVTILGFGMWFYDGLGKRWVNLYWTCAVYEIFWCLFFYIILPVRKHIFEIAFSVFSVTFALEVLQLFRPRILQQIRSTFLGMILIGTSFVWLQVLYYIIGSIIGYLWMSGLSRVKEE